MVTKELKSFFQAVDDNLNEAYEANDANRLMALLSDDWTILEPGMGIVGKINFIEAVKEGRLVHSAMKKEVLQVKSFGNIAIVISKGRNIGQYLSKPFDTGVWVTNIYQKEKSDWVCVATQEAPEPCP